VTSWIRRRSFRGRLTTLVAIAVGIAVALVACASYLEARRELNGQVDSNLRYYAMQIRTSATGNGFSQRAALSVAAQDNNIVEVVPPGGTAAAIPIPADGPATAKTPTITPTAAQRAMAGVTSTKNRLDTVTRDGTRYRVLTMEVSASFGGPVLTSPLLIATPLTQTLNTLARLRLVLYVLLLASIAVAIGLGGVVARVTIRPVKRLTAAAEHVAATQQLDATIDDDGTDELGRLAHAFNEMLGALGASRQQQAQLVSDAGHELRTPLTSLRTNVELMMRAKQLPEADQRELYGDISAQIEELTTLIGDLVELARQDEQQSEPVEVRLDSIVEHAVMRAQRRAPGLTFDVALTPGSVRAHPPLLERAVLNVLDNAAKWSPPGASVEVRLSRGTNWVLEVRDHGPGIAAEDRPKVFDRFYRAPSARAMPGSGLGLAIVHQVVYAHDGLVSIEAPPGGGTLVRIELPIVAEQEPGRSDLRPGVGPLLPPPPPPGPSIWAPPATPVGHQS
jgi:two-component system sensor histidine kinase MprB